MQSKIAIFIIAIVLFGTRLYYTDLNPNTPLQKPLTITTWDALGYYMYLPAIVIYGDVTELKWWDGVNKKYGFVTGQFYQAGKQKNGKYVFKYAGGVAFLQLPFFLAAHALAPALGYPADGFSPPYQYGIAFGLVVWAIMGICVLRAVSRRYFSDHITALTLLLAVLASNAVQYFCVEGAQSHGWIFPMYAFVLYTTLRWHEQPRWHWAFLTGLCIGIATMSRPTEALMLFIPLLWKRWPEETFKEKWHFLMQQKQQLAAIFAGGLLGFLPQMLYWKVATGSFMYTMGSKWYFLNPWFRVLFGWEKGWFIYTPVTILFIAGLWFLRRFPFRKSVIAFSLLNIWIVIAWSDWRYGGTYASRALMQATPVMALALGALLERWYTYRLRWIIYPLTLWLIGVNLFQIGQYNRAILHYNDMNRAYYRRIFLNPSPTPLDVSLMDTQEWLSEKKARNMTLLCDTVPGQLSTAPGQRMLPLKTIPLETAFGRVRWLKAEAEITCIRGVWDSGLRMELPGRNPEKITRIRLSSPVNKEGRPGRYAFYFEVPADYSGPHAVLSIATEGVFEGTVSSVKVYGL